jgi:hypothetical protein
MSDTLCEMEKLLRHDFDAYCQLVVPPRFVCRSCGRAANKKKRLCDPKRIPVADTTAAEATAEPIEAS